MTSSAPPTPREAGVPAKRLSPVAAEEARLAAEARWRAAVGELNGALADVVEVLKKYADLPALRSLAKDEMTFHEAAIGGDDSRQPVTDRAGTREEDDAKGAEAARGADETAESLTNSDRMAAFLCERGNRPATLGEFYALGIPESSVRNVLYIKNDTGRFVRAGSKPVLWKLSDPDAEGKLLG